MIRFKVNSKTVNVPTAWDELTFSQYLQILDLKDDYLQVVSILTGIDYEILKKAEINGLESLIAATSFLSEIPDFDHVTTKVGPYNLPVNDKGLFNIQLESLAQFEDMRAVMKGAIDSPKAMIECYVKFVALYVQKVRDKEYDSQKALLMVDEVKTWPAKEVITAGAFFYVKLRSLLNGTQKTSPLTPRSPKKSKQASKGSRKSSGRR